MKRKIHKDWLLFSTVLISYFPKIFYGSKVRVDWFLLVEHTRRIDYYFFYLGVSLNYLILSYLLLFPKGVTKEMKQFILIVCILDLLHFVLLSKLHFGYIKIIMAIGIFYLLRMIKKNWQMQK
mgnify:CR=1 FL=1